MSRSPATVAPVPAAGRPANKRPLYIAGGVAAGWLLILAWLSLTSANPITVNRLQLSLATLVVEGRVEDLATGKIHVLHTFKGTAPADEMTVRHLRLTGAKAGETYLMPLQPVDRESTAFEVVPTELPEEPRLVYPAVPEAREQAKRILNNLGAIPR